MKPDSIVLFITALAAVYPATSENVMKIDVVKHLEKLGSVRHPFYNDGKEWREAREYIKKSFQYYGERPQEHRFNTSVGSGDTQQQVEGENIIGISFGDSDDNLVIVGADYDTTLLGDPIKDNGGGVAILLEALRFYEHSVRYEGFHKNFTVMFVAFDLNTREQTASTGKPGSRYFVEDWLDRYFKDKMPEKHFRGAIILDSLTIYNGQNNSQFLVNGFDDAFPEASGRIRASGMKGNFLAAYNEDDLGTELFDAFIRNYRKDRKARPFRVEELSLSKAENIGSSLMSSIDKQAHIHFWTYPDKKCPAILLTDTDNSRSVPAEDVCEEDNCVISDARRVFMEYTVQSIVSTLLDLQTTYTGEESSARSISPVGSLILFLSFAVFALRK